jgi:hypothetical protein
MTVNELKYIIIIINLPQKQKFFLSEPKIQKNGVLEYRSDGVLGGIMRRGKEDRSGGKMQEWSIGAA